DQAEAALEPVPAGGEGVLPGLDGLHGVLVQVHAGHHNVGPARALDGLEGAHGQVVVEGPDGVDFTIGVGRQVVLHHVEAVFPPVADPLLGHQLHIGVLTDGLVKPFVPALGHRSTLHAVEGYDLLGAGFDEGLGDVVAGLDVVGPDEAYIHVALIGLGVHVGEPVGDHDGHPGHFSPVDECGAHGRRHRRHQQAVHAPGQQPADIGDLGV